MGYVRISYDRLEKEMIKMTNSSKWLRLHSVQFNESYRLDCRYKMHSYEELRHKDTSLKVMNER